MGPYRPVSDPFLIVHAGVNACIFLNDNGETFNEVAHFMSHNWILRFLNSVCSPASSCISYRA